MIQRREQSRLFGNSTRIVILLVPSIVLMTSSCLKFYSMWRGSFAEALVIGPFELLIALELGMAILIVAGLFGRLVLPAGIGLFICFAVYNLVQLIFGVESCGCFGDIAVPTGLSLAIDFGCIVCLGIVYVGAEPPKNGIQTSVSLIILTVAIVGMSIAIDRLDNQIAASSVVVLRPNEWNDVPGELEKLFRLPNDFKAGMWTVLFYRDGCSDCEKELFSLRQQLDGKLLIVEVGRATPRAGNERVYWRQMPTQTDWILKTPISIKMVDGHRTR